MTLLVLTVGHKLWSQVNVSQTLYVLGLARSLDFSGLGLLVFCLVRSRTGFQFGLFQSLIVYKIDSYHLQFRDRG